MFLFGNQEVCCNMEDNRIKLPELIFLETYGGNFQMYLEAVYLIFKNDFIMNSVFFKGKKLGLKKMPISQGKEATFWHFISEGENEETREPDIRRMERISWPKPIISFSECSDLKVWKNKRNGKDRILIFHEAESYLVVLADRGSYILTWTAYLVTKEHRKRKLLKEYETYKNADTA